MARFPRRPDCVGPFQQLYTEKEESKAWGQLLVNKEETDVEVG